MRFVRNEYFPLHGVSTQQQRRGRFLSEDGLTVSVDLNVAVAGHYQRCCHCGLRSVSPPPSAPGGYDGRAAFLPARRRQPLVRRSLAPVSAPNVEAIQHHDLIPNLNEVPHEHGVPIAARVHLGNGTKLAIRTKNEIASCRLKSRSARRAIIE